MVGSSNVIVDGDPGHAGANDSALPSADCLARSAAAAIHAADSACAAACGKRVSACARVAREWASAAALRPSAAEARCSARVARDSAAMAANSTAISSRGVLGEVALEGAELFLSPPCRSGILRPGSEAEELASGCESSKMASTPVSADGSDFSTAATFPEPALGDTLLLALGLRFLLLRACILTLMSSRLSRARTGVLGVRSVSESELSVSDGAEFGEGSRLGEIDRPSTRCTLSEMRLRVAPAVAAAPSASLLIS